MTATKTIPLTFTTEMKQALPPVMNNVLEAIGNTPMVKINRLYSEFAEANVFAKLEYLNPNGSMKDRIGLGMIEYAEQQGLLKPGDSLVEPTSGNTGLGLCMAAAVKGYPLTITMPMKMSEEKRRLIKAFGAKLILCPTELAHDHPDNYIEVAKRIAREEPNTVMLNQYENPGNPGAHYASTGPEIFKQMDGKIDYFICGMGTGGTISGVGKYLKEQDPSITVVGIDPEGSIFSGDEPKTYAVEGIGYDFWPGVFDKTVIDTMVRVSDKETFTFGPRLAKEEGILAGGSCGTVAAGAYRFLADLKAKGELDGKRVVIMIHDTGRNYLTKMYNDEWLQEWGFID